MRNLVEFYCTESGGGCGGYFTIPVNIKIDGIFEVVCPECGHTHQRRIKDGEISDNDRWSDKPKQEILANPASYSKTPRSSVSKERSSGDYHDERKSVVLEEAGDRSFINDRRFEIHGAV